MFEINIAEIENRISDTLLNSGSWKDMIDDIARLCGSRGAAIIPVSNPKLQIISSSDLEDLDREYRRHWHQNDFRRRALPKMLNSGVAVDQDIVDVREMDSIEFYHDYIHALGFKWFAGVPFNCNGNLWCFTLQRSDKEGLFDLKSQYGLKELGRTISLGSAVARNLSMSRAVGCLEGLEFAGKAAAILDRTGIVLDYNKRMSSYLDNDLGIANGRIFAKNGGRQELESALRVMGADGMTHNFEKRLVFRRLSGRPFTASLRQLDSSVQTVFSPAYAIFLIDDLEALPHSVRDELKLIFHLTSGQAHIADLLSQGLSISEICDKLEISRNTVKTVLKNVFAKMEIRTQAELARITALL